MGEEIAVEEDLSFDIDKACERLDRLLALLFVKGPDTANKTASLADGLAEDGTPDKQESLTEPLLELIELRLIYPPFDLEATPRKNTYFSAVLSIPVRTGKILL